MLKVLVSGVVCGFCAWLCFGFFGLCIWLLLVVFFALLFGGLSSGVGFCAFLLGGGF